VGAGHGHCARDAQPILTGAFQHGKRCMPFVQVAVFRLNAEPGEQPPSADPEYQLLHEAQVRPAAL